MEDAKLTSPYALLLSDVAGTTTPFDFYMNTVPEYFEKQGVAEKVLERTEYDTVEEMMAVFNAGKTETDKSKQSFKDYCHISDLAETVGYQEKDLVMPLNPGVIEGVKRFLSTGGRFEVYSSGSEEALELAWKSTGTLDEITIDAYHSAPDNPDLTEKFNPDSYRAIAGYAGLDVSEVVFITDNQGEAEGAAEAGYGRVFLMTDKFEDGLKDGYIVISNYKQAIDDIVHEDRTGGEPEPAQETS